MVGNGVGGLQWPPPNARFTMDPHPDLHLAKWQFKVRVADSRDNARSQSDAKAAEVRGSVLGHCLHGVEVAPLLCACPSDLVQEEDPGDAAAAAFISLGGRGDIVSRGHCLGADTLCFREFGRQAEVEHVASVVAIEEKDSTATVDGFHNRQHLFCARRREDVADSSAVCETASHITHEHREVPRTPAGCDRHFSFDGGISPHNAPWVSRKFEVVRVRFQNALEHLVDEVFGVVDQLLHNGARLAPRSLS